MRTTTQLWNHTVPDDQDKDLQLLTIGGISVLGRWTGAFGEYFVGWASIAHIPLQPYNHTQQRNHDEIYL